jgi:uncharacterized membrane protein
MDKVLYLGDDSLKGAASYLGGVMAHSNIEFDYVPSGKALSSNDLKDEHGLIILSDYPSSNISDHVFQQILNRIKQGTGLLMIGGWESFYGLNGEYHDTPLAEVLPVECMTSDDRDNYCHGLVPVKAADHAIVQDLPFDNPPVVCGYNKVKPKQNSQIILNLRKINHDSGTIGLDNTDIPFLVLGNYEKAKTAAITTDFAPHWTGGLVDWGKGRVKAQAPEGGEVEVGDLYIKFITSLIKWFL